VIVYDTGALIAAERRDRTMWALHDGALRRQLSPLVPAGVLAQAWRGGPQANLSRLLVGCTVWALDEDAARAVGQLCSAAGTSDVIDASVVVLARAVGAAIVSSDEDDITTLIGASGTKLNVHRV
jgi:predicted nucleic acid-binding protein